MTRLSAVIVRQIVFGLVVVVLTLPLVALVQRAMGLGPPLRGGVLLVGASVVLACVSGGLIGTTVGAAVRARRSSGGVLLALLVGLLWGGVLCSIVTPLYLESALEALAREGVGAVWRERSALLNGDTGLQAAVDGATTLARHGAGRLPVLGLLFWTLLGSAIASVFEARRALRR